MAKYKVSADIGGTFTDIVVEDDAGAVRIGKVPTTKENPALGVLQGIGQLVGEPSEIDFFVHGTTVGLNAFLERRGAKTMLVMTGGISDTYTIARGHRDELYKLHYRKPEQLVPRRNVHEVRERLAWDGSVIAELSEEDFAPIIEKAKAEGFEAIAVCFLHAYANPVHELRAREIIKAALPDISVSLSHQVAPEWREVERASSAVMDAYIAPVVELYLRTLKAELARSGMNKTVHVMGSSGGVMTDRLAMERPITTLMSGPVGGSIGGCELARRTGLQNLLCVDMGGTSFDLSLVVDGQPEMTSETVLEGLPLLMSIVSIDTVGAGGGSIAWVEAGGLRVGPHSAGSYPGPVCYSRGGTQPTVTDANLYLGRLGDDSLLDGKMKLDSEATGSALTKLGAEIGLSDRELAEGILAISNAKMADAMRTITVGQGVDPRDFTLVAFGGAGPMHAVELARELDMTQVMIPRFPGTFSAWGMLQSDIRHDLMASHIGIMSTIDAELLDAEFAMLEEQGRQKLLEENVPEAAMSFARAVDLRYQGQEYTINVPIERGSSVAAVLDLFHSLYERRYGHSQPETETEIISIRLAATGSFEHSEGEAAFAPMPGEPQVGTRDVVFDGAVHKTPILKRDRLAPGKPMASPAIVEEESATSVVPPGYTITIDTFGNMLIAAGESA
ncbi:MAG: N-methylhydantoinase A [Parasphingorhabdus sp.]|jgi:N-methylhydantoinase A|uniref:hydantoinase/oxoprolinase family protein n=1 Tax=Parasphingorhabdus sp. TaxID=2709688 RepID=UPI001B762786|nr:hydantoinase/oxoprolinase family protein [Parasphingorhabdus sp.]MBQ0771091.1 hydantoinase/oxoprolinase family protein [Sphingomonadales bacterium]|tara:strand:+ start:8570 stop:10591 length:2022 start_codon:yes stop_codon:yes gene_type:complete